jgi:hypothetical protein
MVSLVLTDGWFQHGAGALLCGCLPTAW